MDNCLASNSETGGVGCDNMTMIVVGFLRGRSKDEWYEEIARRVANGDGPCAPPEYGMSASSAASLRVETQTDGNSSRSAEFRGPGVHHNFDDSDSGYEVDLDQKSKSFGIGGYKGRIIFLGDGTEVLTDADDSEMFDNSEEDKDLESQVSKGSAAVTVTAEEEKTGSSTAKAAEDNTQPHSTSQNDMPSESEPKPDAKPEPESEIKLEAGAESADGAEKKQS